MKKSLLSVFVMALASFGVANASIDITINNIPQPANDTLLFQLPVTPGVAQEIWNYPDGNPQTICPKFQPEYIVTALDFTKGDTEKGTATLPANAKVIGLGLDGYDIGSDVTSRGVYLAVTAWCRNIPVDKKELDYMDLFDGYNTHYPQGDIFTDVSTYHGPYIYPNDDSWGYQCFFDMDATADDPRPIVDIPFGNSDDPDMPFWYKGENIYLTMWMTNWCEDHMKYMYMAFDDAECENASLMRSGNLCYNHESAELLLEVFGQSLMYELPRHRLPAFRTPYFTNDIRITFTDMTANLKLVDEEGNITNPAEDGNFYSLDHTKTYKLMIDSWTSDEITFGDIYSDLDVIINKDLTAVEEISGEKAVAGVVYYNLAGQESAQPVDGVNIVVTTFTDGTRSVSKVIK